MQALKDAILREGKNLGDGILKIDGILNHQMQPRLIQAMGQEFARRFQDMQPQRVLTAEVSGIGPALMTALALDVPVVYARKKKPITMYGPVLLETAPSHTKGHEAMLLVSAEYMPPGERVLIIDDFLATGNTMRALVRITRGAECELVGIGGVVEKIFEGGRALLNERYPEVRVEALARIASMDDDRIIFAD
ncbi:MAG: xanthine phosphoribosyltransferase [Anaerolineales bacterium]